MIKKTVRLSLCTLGTLLVAFIVIGIPIFYGIGEDWGATICIFAYYLCIAGFVTLVIGLEKLCKWAWRR